MNPAIQRLIRWQKEHPENHWEIRSDQQFISYTLRNGTSRVDHAITCLEINSAKIDVLSTEIESSIAMLEQSTL